MQIIIDTTKASVSETTQSSAAVNLLTALGYDRKDPPLADLLRRSLDLEGEWIALSPVHWQASHNDAVIDLAGEELALTEAEARVYYDLLSAHLAEEGMGVYFYSPALWLLQVNDKPRLKAPPVSQIKNCSLMPLLADFDSTMYWQKFFTECQMLFAAHSLSDRVNGLWPWGGSTLRDTCNVPICADASLLSLANVCSTAVTQYSPAVALKNFSILLFSDLTQPSAVHQQELTGMTAQWYWNNTEYRSQATHWLTLLWRKITHAY